jgi:FkbM family methyltransferase
MARPSEALASYDRAIDLAPGLAEAWNNRGNTLTELGRLAEALASFDRAIALRPDYADAFYNRGNALRKSKRVDEAISSYDRAIALEPKHAEAYMCRGIARLLSGHYPDGWSDYEWRFKIRESQIRRPEIDAHVWQGQSLLGRSIAVFTEQGLGDTIQFARYLPLLAQRGAQVSLLAPTELCRLFRPLNRQIKIINSIEQGQTFDFQCALMSLPLQLGTDLNSVPNQIPYLTPEAERVSHWKTRIGSQGFRIGIAWQGKPQSAIDRGRSIPLSAFIRLARLPGVRLISLQKHDGLEQLWSVPDKVAIETLGDNFDSGPDAFIDCAAVMANLDLVITSDTAIAHLAGALGRPTWVALRKVPDWRWLLEREDSPWYPTMRLFRQTTDGDWADVFSEIEQSLQVLLREQPARREEILHNVKETSIQTGQATEIKGKLLLENANLRLKQCKDGLMMYYANDMFIGRSMDLYGEFSAGEADVFQQLLRPGMTVVDVGANIGTHTLYFANTVERGGRVYAFEPQRFIYNVLCGNVALNGHTNVVAVNAALGSKPGQITVPALDYGRGGNFGGLSLGLNRKGENVPMLTLDSYGLSSCQLIKIDVEGMEKQVLEGAVSLLQAHQPFLYVETDREKNSQELIGWLLARNYRLYWHLPRMFNPNNFFGEKQNVFGNIASINMLCAPASKSFTTNLREITSPQDSWRSR